MAIWGGLPDVFKPSIGLWLSQPCEEEAVERSSAKRQSDGIYKIFSRRVPDSQKQHTRPWPGLLQRGKGGRSITAECPHKGVTSVRQGLAMGCSAGTVATHRPLGKRYRLYKGTPKNVYSRHSPSIQGAWSVCIMAQSQNMGSTELTYAGKPAKRGTRKLYRASLQVKLP